ncbi:YgjP-like metallopeptidase domain-containing protein [Streptomyces sp. NPDC053726]|uniref:YgjP-like metallopeptidase domain-containing protein n=1 Tax=Streptomyces sp. NPDC053726 TaxID=3365713 RepID=UPI0037D95DF3
MSPAIPTLTAAEMTEAIATDGQFTRHVAEVRVSVRRKTLGMTIHPGDEGITLHVPADMQPDEVIRLLSRNRDRLGALLLKARAYAPNDPVKELVGGTGFLWLGRSKRLRLVDEAPEAVRAVDDNGTSTPLGRWLELDRAHLRYGAKPLIDWYIQGGTAWLQREAPYLWTAMAGRRPMPAVRAADIGRKRWGVHDGTTHTIRLAWQTFQLPAPLARHVLTHELTHALVTQGKPHGPEFWRAFERTHPGAQEEARHLHDEGRHVWMGDIHTTGKTVNC